MGEETLKAILDENLTEKERIELIRIEEMKMIIEKFPEYAREMMK